MVLGDLSLVTCADDDPRRLENTRSTVAETERDPKENPR